MGWLDVLSGQLVGIDTAPLIYYIERHPTYFPVVKQFFQALDQGQFTGVTSVITLTEVLVHPLRLNNSQLANQYRRILLRAPNLTMLAVSPAIAEQAGQLRARYNLRTPDALQVATLQSAGAAFFVTNDSRLSKIAGIGVLDIETIRTSGATP
jgi:predicted nucleic acid-binding protein